MPRSHAFAFLGCEPDETESFPNEGHGPMPLFPTIEFDCLVSNILLLPFQYQVTPTVVAKTDN